MRGIGRQRMRVHHHFFVSFLVLVYGAYVTILQWLVTGILFFVFVDVSAFSPPRHFCPVQVMYVKSTMGPVHQIFF